MGGFGRILNPKIEIFTSHAAFNLKKNYKELLLEKDGGKLRFSLSAAVNNRMRSRANLGALEFPRDSCHDIHGVGSSHSDANGAQPTTVGRVGVCADQHRSRVGVVLEDDLFG